MAEITRPQYPAVVVVRVDDIAWKDAEITRLTAERDALREACEELATIALDCKDRWSRGHEARYEAARAAIEKARVGA